MQKKRHIKLKPLFYSSKSAWYRSFWIDPLDPGYACICEGILEVNTFKIMCCGCVEVNNFYSKISKSDSLPSKGQSRVDFEHIYKVSSWKPRLWGSCRDNNSAQLFLVSVRWMAGNWIPQPKVWFIRKEGGQTKSGGAVKNKQTKTFPNNIKWIKTTSL